MSTFQFKRTVSLNNRPNPANMAYGEVNLNTNANSPGMFIKTSANTVVKVGPAAVSDSAPVGQGIGEIWLDTIDERLKIYDGTGWVPTSKYETYPMDILSTPPLHVWGVQPLIGTNNSPYNMALASTRHPNEVTLLKTQSDLSRFNNNLYAEYNDEDELTVESWYDQVSRHTLKGTALFYKKGLLNWRQVGSLYAPTSTIDLSNRAMRSAPAQLLNETGTAMWCIVQFNYNNQAQDRCLFSAGGDSFVNGSFQFYRAASGLQFQRNVNGATSVQQSFFALDSTSNGKNTILIVDRGLGNITTTLNGSAPSIGIVPSSGASYLVGKVAVGGPLTASALSNWLNPISLVSYWIGTPANMPTSQSLYDLAEEIHNTL